MKIGAQYFVKRGHGRAGNALDALVKEREAFGGYSNFESVTAIDSLRILQAVRKLDASLQWGD